MKRQFFRTLFQRNTNGSRCIQLCTVTGSDCLKMHSSKEAVIHCVHRHASQDSTEIMVRIEARPGTVPQVLLLRIPDPFLFALYISHSYHQSDLFLPGESAKITIKGSEASDMGVKISAVHPHTAAAVYPFKAEPELPSGKILRNRNLSPVIIFPVIFDIPALHGQRSRHNHRLPALLIQTGKIKILLFCIGGRYFFHLFFKKLPAFLLAVSQTNRTFFYPVYLCRECRQKRCFPYLIFKIIFLHLSFSPVFYDTRGKRSYVSFVRQLILSCGLPKIRQPYSQTSRKSGKPSTFPPVNPHLIHR